MYNRPHKQNNMWCANVWVGAPWACGEALNNKYVENYEHDITNSYGLLPNSITATAGTAPTGDGGTCNELVSVFPSACDMGDSDYGCVVTSPNLYPWVGDGTNGTSGVLYGFVAQYCGDSNYCGSNSEGCTKGMGAVYEITFESGKIGYVQVINCGDIKPNTEVFDFLVPGGGMGTKTGCKNMPGWKMSAYCSYEDDTKYCKKYGGIFTEVDADAVFPGDATAATALTDVLRNPDYFYKPDNNTNSGNATLTSVQYIDPASDVNTDPGAAIEILSALSGIKQSTISQYVGNFTDGNMTMTHYWDCCKPNVISNPLNESGGCPLGYRTASIINSEGNGFTNKGEGNSKCISDYNTSLYDGCCIYAGGTCTEDHGATSTSYCGKNAANCADCGQTDANAYFNAYGELVFP